MIKVPTRYFLAFFVLLIVVLPLYFMSLKVEYGAARNLDLGIRHHVTPPAIPSNLEFAGEKVPLHIPDVYERMERELLINAYWESNTILMMKKAARWLPYIDSILKAHGVPSDFKYIPIIESRLSNEISPAGAAGFWHLLPHTGKEMGLTINEEVDERYHPGKATEAAARYLKKARDKFGSWSMAAASYNRGMAGLRRAVLHQKQADLYDLKLNDESTRYIFRILTFKLLLNDPKAYGFYLRDEDLYRMPGIRKVMVEKSENWVSFAARHGATYKHIRILNPWIQDKRFRNLAGRPLEIWVPVDPVLAGEGRLSDSLFHSLEDSSGFSRWDSWDDGAFLDTIE